MARGADKVIIKASGGGMEFSVPLACVCWKARRKRWVVWSPFVHDAVERVANDERVADVKWKILKKQPELGDWVSCKVGAERSMGFVVRKVVDGYLISLPQGRKWVVAGEHIVWNEADKMWRSRVSLRNTPK